MKFIPVWSYDNYVPAHIAMGRLKEEGMECWLKDEHTVTIDPLLTNAVGGIKLMVAEVDAEKAWNLLKQLQTDYKAGMVCIKCGSSNIEWVSTPRNPSTWLSAIATFFLGDYALVGDKVYHCFNCKHESTEVVQKNTDISKN
jgi:Putative prokaryotic signal transducing protein